MSLQMKCPGYKCGVLVDEEKVSSLIDEKHAAKFELAKAESFVNDNPRVKWCPSVPCCGRAVMATLALSSATVSCTCGHSFSFCCLTPGGHILCTCDMFERWKYKMKDDSGTADWLRANTKPCPRCKKMIEKNTGCNHMTCKCGASFCWICGEETGRAHSYNSIEGHKCGGYTKEKEKENSKNALARYLHYVTRYEEHNKSLEIEQGEKMLETVRMQSEIIEEAMKLCKFTNINTDWLAHAHKILCYGRICLRNSYCFAFYAFGEGDKEEKEKNDARKKSSKKKNFGAQIRTLGASESTGTLDQPPKLKREYSAGLSRTHQDLFEDHQQQFSVVVERLANLLQGGEASNILAPKNIENIVNRGHKSKQPLSTEAGAQSVAEDQDEFICTDSFAVETIQKEAIALIVNVDKRARALTNIIQNELEKPLEEMGIFCVPPYNSPPGIPGLKSADLDYFDY